MFTGIIEGTGSVKSISKIKSKNGHRRSDVKLTVYLGRLRKNLKVGNSVSIDGVCLTITALYNNKADFDLVEETTNRTCLGSLNVGDKVNIERSLRVGDRLEGHLVLGHVDTTGMVEDIDKSDSQIKMWIRVMDREVLRSIVTKGSIAVNGTSLTVVDITAHSFSVVLIPHTALLTTLGRKSAGDVVNIESDIISKYVSKVLPKK
ncbi:MAG TPA: riboflavin synthase [Nitrososphaeraceae archaeon]|nr:riboflavin synthase [Nitrososphaeraceae archaeon]